MVGVDGGCCMWFEIFTGERGRVFEKKTRKEGREKKKRKKERKKKKVAFIEKKAGQDLVAPFFDYLQGREVLHATV